MSKTFSITCELRDVWQGASDEYTPEQCFDRLVACCRACAGLADPERDVAELVAALRRLKEVVVTELPGTYRDIVAKAEDLLARHRPGGEA